MKKKYEKDQLLISLIVIYIVIFVIFFIIVADIKYRKYKVINGMMVTRNYIQAIVDNNNYKNLLSSKKVYIDNKKKNIEFVSTNRNVIKKDNKYYHEIILKTKLPKKYKDNDNIIITIYDNRKKVIEIFKTCIRRNDEEIK